MTRVQGDGGHDWSWGKDGGSQRQWLDVGIIQWHHLAAQTLWAKGNKHELCPIDLLAEVEREKRMYLKVEKKKKKGKVKPNVDK